MTSTPIESPVASDVLTQATAGEQAGFAGEEHLVIFYLGDEQYGLDIAQVWEINEVHQITRVPRTPHFIEGVINLRGQITPVIDLRKRLNLPFKEHGRETRIIVVQVNDTRLGIVVDGVREVIKVPGNMIEPPSQLVATVNSTYIRGIAKLEDRLVILFDLERLLTEDEGATLTDIKETAAAGSN